MATESIVDILGIGFGPANMSLAATVIEHNQGRGPESGLTQLYLERKPNFSWHSGMLIEGATMQIPFIKDLATMRNPASKYTFLSYLHSKGRMHDFINQKTLYPSRLEFHDYLEWVASALDQVVTYDSEVFNVRPVPGTDYVEVLARSGESTNVYRARNVVIGAGLVPLVPTGFLVSDRAWHSSDLLHRVGNVNDPKRVAVIGAGQSAAEVVGYLHERFPQAEVLSIFGRYGYSASDDTPFANRMFDPSAVDVFFGAPQEVSQRLLGYHSNTNYSVVDSDLIDELYRRHYGEKLRGKERLRILNMTTVERVDLQEAGALITVQYLPTGDEEKIDIDLAIYATGYKSANIGEILGDTLLMCNLGANGELLMSRSRRICTEVSVRAGLYVQGGPDDSFGISSGLLSNVATRSSEILQSILDGDN
ncbi:lysine N(6)-hydroxylase/L-ornithine N(5)-oxygenase family protein [Nocardia sp. NPDC057272]|uniref:lysine N(6)-hydroxylase/L-ornithine N(5)-oxygenase family protein n=1 Tax=Nocardia sp. NPDC057272 TaxID=3346079 RepID=UPI0036283E25